MKIWIVGLLATLVLAGCGKKPQTVDPPQGKQNDTFPRTYPNPAAPQSSFP